MPKVFFSKYKQFKCLASECPMNCCKVFKISFFDWETKQFGRRADWNDIDGKGGDLRDYLSRDESGWFCKSVDGACTFFDQSNSLCGIQLRHNALAMPSVCRTYPRIITRYPDRTEFALDPCCPAVANLLHGWEIGELEMEGEWKPSDDIALRRGKMMDMMADESVSLQDCLCRIQDEYGVIAEAPTVELSDRKCLNYTRRFVAFMLWSYLLPYDGIGILQNMAALILDITACYLKHLQNLSFEDEWAMSRDLSTFLLDYVERMKFDVEIEGRYVDSKDVH